MSAVEQPAAEVPVDPGKAWRKAHGVPIVAALDGYRALAVCGVLLFHVLQVCGALTVAGASLAGILIWGVLPGSITVFFIVSGFVMFLPTAVRNGDFGSVRAFAIGRAARLLPAYWLALAVALLLLAGFAPAGTGLPDPGTIFAHLGMLQSPVLLLDGPVTVGNAVSGNFQLGFGVIPPVWTLSVEAAFYIILPLIAASYFRRPLVGLAIAAAMLIAWQLLCRNIGDVGAAVGIDVGAATESRFATYYASQFPTWAFAIASGMTGAWAYVWLRRRVAPALLERRARLAAAIAAPLGLLVVYLAGDYAVTDPNALSGLFARQPLAITLAYPLVAASLMVALALAPRALQLPLTNRPIRALADISYSVYLIHFAVIWYALAHLGLPQTGSVWSVVVWSALVFGISLGYAWLAARYVERPIRRWAHTYRRRNEPVAAALQQSGS